MSHLQEAVIHAEQVRKSYELFRNLNEENKKLYYPDLGGLCAKASYALFDRLKNHNMPVAMAGNDQHFFVICDNHIIDVTATQFGHTEPVVVKPIEEADKDYWTRIYTFETYPEITDYFTKSAWPTHQKPNV